MWEVKIVTNIIHPIVILQLALNQKIFSALVRMRMQLAEDTSDPLRVSKIFHKQF